MASKKMIAQVLASINQIYPNLTQNEDAKLKAGLWEKLLQDYEDEQVSSALYYCLQELKYPPTPADLIERLKPSKTELWALLCDKLSEVDNIIDKYQYEPDKSIMRQHLHKIWNELPCELQNYLGTYNNMITMSGQPLHYEKSVFFKSELRGNKVNLLENNNRKELKE